MEAEFELLTVEEAEKRPVGKRRKEPEASEKPKGAGRSPRVRAVRCRRRG